MGLVIVVEAQAETIISKAISNFYECYPIGEVVKDGASVVFEIISIGDDKLGGIRNMQK